VTEWGSYQYTVIPFGLKNSSAIFSTVVVADFKEYTHKFLEVYFDDWTIFGFPSKHIRSLRLMLHTCRQYQISFNLKKCIFCVPFGILLGHIFCKQGLMVDPDNISIIVNFPPPKIVRQLHTTLRYTRYYRKFIKGYAQITALMEKLLKKDVTFQWNEECHKSVDILK